VPAVRPHVWLAAGVLTLTSLDAGAVPRSVKLSWASEDTATTIGVSWVTDTNTPTVIEYGIQSVSEHQLTARAPTEIAGIGWFHEIELGGLTPSTTYRYRVGTAGDFSSEYTFRTGPSDLCEPFVFAALGDARSQNNRGPSVNWSSIHSEAEGVGARFFLNGGDLVRDGAEIDQWAVWLTDSEAVNPRVPMMPCIGNHDDGPGDGDSANYNRLFVLPRNTVTGTEDYYAFTYGNLLVFSLSTQTFDDWQAQADWIRSVAAQHPSKWKIAYFHHPVFTTQTTIVVDVGHPPNEKGQNPFYGPAFDDAGIDVVIQSHNHIYERFRPLRYDAADPAQGREVANYGSGPNDGRLYIVTGGAGAFLDPLIEASWVDFSRGSEARSKDHHFLKFSVAGSTLQMSAIRTNAGNSSGGGTVIDTVTLTRPGTDPCTQPADPDGDADGYPASRDCDDLDPAVSPGAAEICGNLEDEDCSGTAETCPVPPADGDNDGSPLGTDCDDADPARFPEQGEIECDGVDNDCDCFELCGGQRVDRCASDAGIADAPSIDALSPLPPLPADASASSDVGFGSFDAGHEDAAGSTLATIDDGCSCRSAPSTERSSLLAWGLLLCVITRRRFARRVK
jgi:hypothetical protein